MQRISLAQVETSERFFKIPKAFSEDERYAGMSIEAKYLYGLLKDRFNLSVKNKWVDSEGDVYLIYTIEEISEMLDCGKNKAIKHKKELQKYGLLEEVRQGLNKPNLLYLGNVVTSKAYQERKFKNQTSRGLKNKHQEVSNLNPNKTNYNKTENKDDISSRKAEKISEEISRPAGADESLHVEKSEKYIPPQYYSLLQVIADKYNDRYLYPEGYSMTHKQKMRIGEYLSSGYVSSNEILSLIDRIPKECHSPYAYLVKSIDNLKTERIAEIKAIAHRNAERHYGEVG